jgi:rubrerythrin
MLKYIMYFLYLCADNINIKNYNVYGGINMDISSSETALNLMRAFAGESQARNRYTFAAEKAKKEHLYVLEAVFKYTADQEKTHAEVFMGYLKSIDGETIKINGGYPVETSENILQLLKNAEHNELEEHDTVYSAFAQTARSEGFDTIANTFLRIADIEKCHSERFRHFHTLLENNRLFVSDIEEKWICLNCGYEIESKNAPKICPVCNHEQGYFIRLAYSPFSKA